MRVSGEPPGWTLKSIVVAGRDVSDEPLEITGGDVTGVVVTFTDRPSELSGVVRDEHGDPDGAARVIVFPSDRPRSSQGPPGPRRGRSTGASRTGAYSFSGLPAGDYYVVAVDDRIDVNAQDPKTLEALGRIASRVTIRDSDTRTQDLTTAQIRQTS